MLRAVDDLELGALGRDEPLALLRNPARELQADTRDGREVVALGKIVLDALAADCAADGVWTCLLVAPPLRVTGGVGSPINPLAVK